MASSCPLCAQQIAPKIDNWSSYQRAEQALAAGASEQWIPVTERLPLESQSDEKQIDVLAYSPNEGIVHVTFALVDHSINVNGFVWEVCNTGRGGQNLIFDVTHWRLLPTPPKWE